MGSCGNGHQSVRALENLRLPPLARDACDVSAKRAPDSLNSSAAMLAADGVYSKGRRRQYHGAGSWAISEDWQTSTPGRGSNEPFQQT